MRLGAPPTSARTRWTLGFQRRRLRLWEWLTDIPTDGFLPQTSHTEAIGKTTLPVRSEVDDRQHHAAVLDDSRRVVEPPRRRSPLRARRGGPAQHAASRFRTL